jgi:pyridinium-3,5-biscarboxylic acid mononucleotide sulfurtransferase
LVDEGKAAARDDALNEMTSHEKQDALDARLRTLGGLLVAYSGGVDSAYLAWRAHEILGEGMRAIIADSASLARQQLAEAVAFAKKHAIPLEIIATNELENPDYAKNDLQRCFHCKNELFTVMKAARERLGSRHLAYGMNLDDRGDFRPGQKAAERHDVLAPLVDAGLTKADIRELAREAGLGVWDKPAAPCLSSRIAYGLAVTPQALGHVEQAEDFLRGLGLRQFRVRHHGDIARIEIAVEEMPAVLEVATMGKISERLKAIGFKHVALECGGFQSGSLHANLRDEGTLAES